MWEKIKLSLARFMQGRYGADSLGRFLVWVALILYVLGMFIPYVGGLFSFLGLATLIYTLFRMFSRNTARRTAENAGSGTRAPNCAPLFRRRACASRTARSTSTSAAPSATPG